MDSNKLSITKRTSPRRIERLYFRFGNNPVDDSGKTVLHHAVWADNLRAVKALIALNCDLEVCDNEGYTSLFYSVMFGHSDVCEMLLDSDANPNAREPYNNTPLHISYIGVLPCMRHLIVAGADVNALNVYGMTPLFFSVSNRRDHECVDFLLKHGANPHITNVDGNSPLHFAIPASNLDTIKLLLHHGLDPNARNQMGESALDHARRLTGPGAEEVLALLSSS